MAGIFDDLIPQDKSPGKLDDPSQKEGSAGRFEDLVPRTTAGDVAKSLVGGAVQGVGSILQGGGNLVAQGINRVSEAVIGRNPMLKFDDPLRGIEDAIEDSKTTGGKRAKELSTPSGDVTRPETWSLGEKPSIGGYLQHGANVIGQFVGPGAISLSAKAARAGVLTQEILGALQGGLQAGGAAADEEGRAVRGASHDDLMRDSQAYRAYIAKGMSPDEAKERTALDVQLGAGTIGAIPAAAEGAVLQGLLRGRLHMPVIGAKPATRVISAAAGGALAEGAQEGIEGVAQKVGANVGGGMDKSITDDSFQNVILGAIGGAAGGGTIHAISRDGPVIGARPEPGPRPLGEPANERVIGSRQATSEPNPNQSDLNDRFRDEPSRDQVDWDALFRDGLQKDEQIIKSRPAPGEPIRMGEGWREPTPEELARSAAADSAARELDAARDREATRRDDAFEKWRAAQGETVASQPVDESLADQPVDEARAAWEEAVRETRAANPLSAAAGLLPNPDAPSVPIESAPRSQALEALANRGPLSAAAALSLAMRGATQEGVIHEDGTTTDGRTAQLPGDSPAGALARSPQAAPASAPAPLSAAAQTTVGVAARDATTSRIDDGAHHSAAQIRTNYAQEEGQRNADAETAVRGGVQGVGRGAQPLQQPQEQGLSVLRRSGDQDGPGVGELVRAISGGPGPAADAEIGSRSDRQFQGVLGGQLPLGDDAGVGTESTLRTDSDVWRSTDDVVGGRARAGHQSDDALASLGGSGAVNRGRGDAGMPAHDAHAVGGVERRDAHGQEVVREAGHSVLDATRAVEANASRSRHDAGVDAAGDTRISQAIRALGGLDPAEAHAVIGRPGLTVARQAPGVFAMPATDSAGVTRKGHSLRGLVQRGDLDAYLPPELRQLTGTNKSRVSEAVTHASGVLRADIETQSGYPHAERDSQSQVLNSDVETIDTRHADNIDVRANNQKIADADDDPLIRQLTGPPSQAVVNLFGGKSISSSGNARKMVSAALKDLIDNLGMPRSALDGIEGIHIDIESNPGGALYYPSFRTIAIGDQILREVAWSMPLAARALRGMLVHEVGHHLDNGPSGFFSAIAPSFEIEVNDEGRRIPVGGIAKEAWNAYLTGSDAIRTFLRYPFAKMERPETPGMSREKWTNILKAEIHAQLFRLYFTNPEALRTAMPKAFDLYREIHEGLRAAEQSAVPINTARRAVRRALLQRRPDGSVAGTSVDGRTLRSAQESNRGRQAGARVGGTPRDERGASASTTPRVKPDHLDVREAASPSEPAPLWHSALERAVTDKAPFAKDGTIGAGQLRMWLAARSKDGTVKPDEVKWSGIDDYLAAQGGKVSRDQVKAFLAQNGVKVEEVELGKSAAPVSTDARSRALYGQEFDDLTEVQQERVLDSLEASDDSTKFSNYQLPGGKNYRELLLTLPRREATTGSVAKRLFGTDRITSLTSAQMDQVIETMRKEDGTPGTLRDYSSPHFTQPNILAHVRFNERTDANGGKVLFIEELQSDWAQKGRKSGFTSTPSERERLTKRMHQLEAERDAAPRDSGEWHAIDVELADIKTQRDNNGTPQAPFVGKTEAWVALAIKRMIRYAADHGFDSIAWTTGEQQAERYDLSKHIDEIRYAPSRDGKTVSVEAMKGDRSVLNKPNMSMGELADTFGKEVATKIENGEFTGTDKHSGYKVLSGVDLQVGGEGMHSFYDKIVPNVANDVLKKLGGGKVESIVMGGRATSSEGIGGKAQPGFAIGPELWAEASRPQVLFAMEGSDIPKVDAAVEESVVPNVGHRFANRMRDLRSIGLQFLGRRQLVEIYGDDIPDLHRYNGLAQQMDAEKNEGGAEADTIADRWGKLRDEAVLADVMHDATVAGIDPDKPYVDGDNMLQYGALRRRFEGLSDDAKAVYRDARKAYNQHWFAVRDAIRDKIERTLPDSPRRAEMLKRMDREFFGRVKGVYFPLQRFGDYVVRVKDANGETAALSMAETLNEAEALRMRLIGDFPKAKGYTVSKILARKEFNAGRDSVGRGFLQDLFAVLDESGVGTELQDAVNQLYLSSLPDASWAKHGLHRKGTPGFSQDARRAFAASMFHGARYLAKLRYADQLQDALQAMQDHVDGKASDHSYDSIAAQKAVDEMVKRHEEFMNPKVNSLSTALTSFGFIWYLGLSPASAAVNLTQTALVAYPLLGARWGFGKAGAALLQAAKETMAARNDLRKSLHGDEAMALDRAVKTGVVDVSLAQDLAGIASGSDSKVHGKLRPVMKAASFLFHHAERFNRQATFMAAYRLAREAGRSHEAAYADAVDMTYKSQFDYSAGNRPRVMQGNVARVLLLFRQFAQNAIYTLSRNAYEAAKGDPEARKAFAGLLVTHALGAGVLGLPVVGMLLSAASMAGGSDDEPWDAEVALRNLLADVFGQKAGEVIVHGLSRLTPWDISGRIGLDRLIFPDVQEGLEGARLAESWSAGMLGPVAGIGVNAVKGLQDMAEGNYSRGLEGMLPAALRAPVKALRYAHEGEVTRKGIPVLQDVSLTEQVGQALGFAPGRVREAQEAKAAVMSEDERLKKRRTEIMAQFGKAFEAHDQDSMNEATAAIQKWNEAHPQRVIGRLHLAASIRLRQQRRAESENGIALPRARRAELQEVGHFGYQQ